MKLRNAVPAYSLSLLLAFLSILTGSRVAAQTTADAASAAPTPAIPARITQAIDETQMVTLKGNVHPLARPEFDQGAAPDSQPMQRMMLRLQRSADQQTGLQQLMAGQLTKSSPNYHKWLTPQQFGQQFGPADADIQILTDWLTSHGFQGIKVANGRILIEFSGTAGQVRDTFHTEIHRFLVNGANRSANVSDPQIPAALAPVVAGFVTLNNFPMKSSRRDAGIHTISRDEHGIPQFSTASGCGAGQTQPCYIVGPGDLAKIYNIPPALDGTGVVIGIVGDSNIDPNDIAGFRSVFGLPPSSGAVGLTVFVDGPDPGINGDEGEADLDVQTSGGVAPKATIKFVTAEGTLTAQGQDIASFRIIDDNLADVMTESFGICEANLASDGLTGFYNSVFEQAAAQGITVTISAGDSGSAGCDDFETQADAVNGLAVSATASTPFNVAVGGTDFDDFTTQTSFWNVSNVAGTFESAKGYIHETTWNDSCAATATSANLTVCTSPNGIAGGSGGPSAVNPKPFWQTALTPVDGHRDLPDVSLFASDGPQSHSFYPVCEADTVPPGSPPSCNPAGNFVIGGAGGTSASSPAFAGMMALIVQQEKGRQGNVNPVLYKIAGTAGQSCNSTSEALTGSTCSFNDITKGNNSVPCSGGAAANCSATTGGVIVDPNHTTTPAWTTAAGYDYATGLGSVNVTNLAAAWKTVVTNFTPSTTSLTLNGGTTTVVAKHGTSVAFAATVTNKATGDVSIVGPAGMINTGVDFATLSGGSPSTVSSSTTFLPGGTYNVTAQYPGDGTFAPSISNPVQVQINKESSRLQIEVVQIDPFTDNFISTNATSYPYGSLTLLRMDILNSSAGLCNFFAQNGDTSGCAIDATGTVTVTDNGSALDIGAFTVNSAGSVEDQALQLTGGNPPKVHTISATYSGDLSYSPPAAATTEMVTVSQATTAASVAPIPGSVSTGAQIALSATITTQSVSPVGPTGMVTFFSGGVQIGSPVALVSSGAAQPNFASGTATLTTSFATSGMKSITAGYNGDMNYATSGMSAAISVNVTGAAAPTITTLSPTSVNAGAAAFPLMVNGTGFVSGAQVNFGANTPTTTFVSATQVTAAITAAEVATAVANIAVSVTNPSGGGTSNSVNFTVNAMAGSFMVSGPANPVAITAGSNGPATITVKSTGGFTGMVTVNCPATANLPPGVTCTAPAAITVTANGSATGNMTFNVAAPSGANAMASVAPVNRMIYAAGITPPQRGNGWWMLTAGTGLAACVLLLLPGRKKVRAALRLGLVCVLSFTLGCGGGGGGGGVTMTATTTHFTITSMSKNAAGSMFSFTATVTGGTPTGQVQLFDNGTATGNAVAVSNGTANVTTAALTVVGTHTISAHYLGDATTLASQSAGTLNVTVTGTTPALTIAGASGSTMANGSVTLMIN